MRAENPLGVIQKFLLVFALYVAIPPFVELITGIQFVSASDELAIKEGSLKGLFFNPNNLAATAVCLAPAILFFFQLQGRKHKRETTGLGIIFTTRYGHFCLRITHSYCLLPFDFTHLYSLS